jgi:hypothetical protein
MNMARSGGFIETSKRNPCTVCGNDNGHCKTKDGDRGDLLAYCHKHAIKPSGSINGQLWLKPDKTCHWGIFAPQSTLADSANWRTAEERDKAFRAFIASRKLDAVDRAELNARGLTDAEIAAWDVVSFGGKQPGYLVPCYNPAGLIVGAQWRVRDPKGGSRYKWISWIDGGSKFEDELPLTVQRPIGSIPTGIAVCEGIGAKSFILAQRTGMATIGAGSDSQFISSPRQWRQYLRVLSTELDCNTLVFYPDAGAVRNASVLGKYREWFGFVAELGYTVQVAWWGQAAKGESPDPDQLAEDTEINLLTVAEFCAIADKESAPPKANQFIAAVRELVESGKDKSEVAVEAHALAVAHQFTGNVAELIRNQQDAAQQSDEMVGYREKLEREIKNRNFTVPLEKLFPGPNGAKFIQWVRWSASTIGVDPLALIFTWMPGIASVSRQDSRIWLGNKHFAKPILWACVVGGVGRGKTPAQDAAIDPLVLLDTKEQESYDLAMKEYDAAMQRYRKSGKSPDGDPGDEPEEPAPPRNYILSDITMESLALTQSAQPDHGMLIYYDELAGLISGMGQYKGGKGNDRQKFLQTFGGKPLKVTRANKTRVFCKSSSISVTGTIQYEVLGKMDTTNDDDGMWARFNFLISDAKNLRPAAPEKVVLPDFNPWLADIYKRVSAFEAKTYPISNEGFPLYKRYSELMTDRVMAATRPVFAGIYSKARGKVGSFALVLHLMNAAIENEQPADEISAETIAAATDLMSLSVNQAHQLIERGDEEMGGTEAVCAAIWRYVDRRPDKSSDWQSISRGVSALRPKAGSKKSDRINGKSSVMEFLRLLEQSGCGQFLGDGRFMVSDLSPAKPAESTEGVAAEEVPLPDFVPDAEPETVPESEPAADEPVASDVIGMGDRVIITDGEHHGGFATVTEITEDYARVQEPGGHRSIPDLNALVPLAHLLKYTEARASEWRRKSREV